MNNPTSTERPEELLGPGLMAKLSQVSLAAPKTFPGSSTGKRFSRARGSEGMEFADHKQYSPGDDFRSIDWNVYARLDELVVKNFETQENLRINVLLDASGSMAFGKPAKGAVAKSLAAALAYIGFINEDWTGVFAFTDALRERYLPKGKPSTAALLDVLDRTTLEGKTNFSAALKAFSIQNTRPGLAFLISDFCSASTLDEGLRSLVYANYSIVALHITDPADEAPDLSGEMDLEDMESGETIPLTVRGNTLQEYKRMHQQHCTAVAKAFALYDAVYLRISTQEPVEHVILGSLKQQRVVRQR
ncbi:MAG TPA: DUF58 domain-containing protein [Planctomycetota bacterium]